MSEYEKPPAKPLPDAEASPYLTDGKLNGLAHERAKEGNSGMVQQLPNASEISPYSGAHAAGNSLRELGCKLGIGDCTPAAQSVGAAQGSGAGIKH